MRNRARTRPPRGPSIQSALIAALLLSAAGIGYTADGISFASSKPVILGSNCNIKGNISINTGERIYHVPGQRFYTETRISPEYGERWFCSEGDARRAGWRKARQ